MDSNSSHVPHATEAVFAEYFVMLVLGLIVIGLRITSRIAAVGKQRLWWDDYIMILAAFLLVIYTILACVTGALWRFMANNGLTDAERKDVIVGGPEYWIRTNGSKAQVANQNVYTVLLWTIKCSICMFYLRFTSSLAPFKRASQIIFVFTGITWFWIHVTFLAACYPFYKYWQINPDPGTSCQAAISPIFLKTCLVLDVITDLCLLAIPMFMLWKATMPLKKKFGLVALFAVTIVVIAVAVARYVSIDSSPGFTGAKRSTDWAFREIFMSIATSNLPIIVSSTTAWNRARKRSHPDIELGTVTTYNTTTCSTICPSKEENIKPRG